MDVTTVAAAYRSAFHTEPELIVRAPGRINLIGEHTDYNGGFVMPAAIDKVIWFAAGRRNDGAYYFHALDLSDSCTFEGRRLEPLSEHTWANYLLGVLSEMRRDGADPGGLNLVFGGDIPLGAGLSSSAALESGTAFIFNTLYGLAYSRMALVKLAQRAENNFVGMQCGIMDMFASIMGRADHVVRLDCRSLEYEYFPFDAPEYTLVLCNSGVKHVLVDSEYNTRRRECETGVTLLAEVYPEVASLRDVTPGMLSAEQNRLPETVFRRCKYVVEEIERVRQAGDALQRSDFSTFGQLMFDTHRGLQYEYEVSCPELDFLVEQAHSLPADKGLSGAVAGARMMGGGFGGCSINLVRKAQAETFIQHMKTVYQEQYGLSLACHTVALTNGVETIEHV